MKTWITGRALAHWMQNNIPIKKEAGIEQGQLTWFNEKQERITLLCAEQDCSILSTFFFFL